MNSYLFRMLGDYLKEKENTTRFFIDAKRPIFIRLDGKAFHTYTKGFQKPFDRRLIDIFKNTTIRLCESIMNVKLAYSQSDEITLFLDDFDEEKTEQWFGGNIQKMASVSSSIATYYFNDFAKSECGITKPAFFDSRVFFVNENDIASVFIWRQTDAIRNSISALAQSHFSQNQLNGKNQDVMLSMLNDKKVNWHELPKIQQRGFCAVKEKYEIPVEDMLKENPLFKMPDGGKIIRNRWVIDEEIPVFENEPEYIQKHFKNEIQ